MTESRDLDVDSPGILTHLTIMQNVIQRMADNSRSCKLWCVTLVAATLVLVARTGEPEHALIALIPTMLFLFLDAYYLALERAFRYSFNAFVGKLHRSELAPYDVFGVGPTGMGLKLVGRCLVGSVSIMPFYLLLTVTILLAWLLIIPSDSFLS